MFGEHDRDFWHLTREIETEVERNDWRSGGRPVTGEEFYNPHDGGVEGGHVDGGGWEGGEFVLGGALQTGSAQGLSRREVMAKAAEERIKRLRDVGRGEGGGRGGEAA